MSKTSRHRKKLNHLSSYKGLIFSGNSNPYRHLLKTTRILGSALFFLLFSVIAVNLFFAKSASAAGDTPQLTDYCENTSLKDMGGSGDLKYRCTHSRKQGYTVPDNYTCKDSDYATGIVKVVYKSEFSASYTGNDDNIKGGLCKKEPTIKSNAPIDSAAACKSKLEKEGLLTGTAPGAYTSSFYVTQAMLDNSKNTDKKDGKKEVFPPGVNNQTAAKGVKSPGCYSVYHPAINTSTGSGSASATPTFRYKLDGSKASKSEDEAAMGSIAAVDPSGNVTNDPVNKTDVEDPDAESSCNINGIGWIICPVMNFLGELADSMYGLLKNFLVLPSSLFTDAGLTKAHAAFLPLANGLLAIVFLMIIYSEATGNGFGVMSNYTIKKTLPKLIIFAILINISLYICAAAVDISNIVGANMNAFFDGVITGLAAPTAGAGAKATGAGWAGIVVLVVAGVAAVMLGALAMLIPMLILVIIALLVCIGVLIFRQVAVILLIVLAPIAFALAILPNTKSLFNKWRKMFMAMLIIYPEIGLIYGASHLASAILNTTSIADDKTGGVIIQIIAASVSVVPLLAVPMVLKSSLNGLGKIGGIVGGFMAGRMTSQQKSFANSRKKAFDNSIGKRSVVSGSGRIAGGINSRLNKNPNGLLSKGTKAFGMQRGLAGLQAKGNAARSLPQKLDDELDKISMDSAGLELDSMISGGKTNKELLEMVKNDKTSGYMKRQILANEGFQKSLGADEVQSLYETASLGQSKSMRQAVVNAANKSGKNIIKGGMAAGWVEGGNTGDMDFRRNAGGPVNANMSKAKQDFAKTFTTAKMVGADDKVITNLMKDDPVAAASLNAVMADMTDRQVSDIVDEGVKSKVLAGRMWDEAQAQNESFDRYKQALNDQSQIVLDHRDASQDLAQAQIQHQAAQAGTDHNQKIAAQRNLRGAESNWQKADDNLNKNRKDISDHEKRYP